MRTFKIQCPNCKEMVPVYRIGSYAILSDDKKTVVSKGALCPKCNEPMVARIEGDGGRAWISVKDKLPEEDGLYLIYAPSADENKPLRTTAWYDPRSGWSLLPEIWVESITHWMPLPEPLEGVS